MQLKALKRFSARRPGDVFEANERLGKLLKKLGRAVDVEHAEPDPVPVPVPEPERRGPGRPRKVEEPTPVAEVAPQPVRAPTYHRRDMTAEEAE